MKTFEQWYSEPPTKIHSKISFKDAELEAWNACAAEYKKGLHDMAGKIQSAQLRAEVAERKLRDAHEFLNKLATDRSPPWDKTDFQSECRSFLVARRPMSNEVKS